MIKAYSADTIFTGNTIEKNCAVIIENNFIKEVIPLKNLPADVTVVQHAPMIAPAFIDIQIYGASSKLFSVYPSPDTLQKIKEYCEKGGAKYFLPTIATNTNDVFKKGIDAVKEYWRQNRKGIPGLHLEGPWLNKLKRAAHPSGPGE